MVTYILVAVARVARIVEVGRMLSVRVLYFGVCIFFFFNDTATTEIYTLSLHGRSSDLWTVGRTARCHANQPAAAAANASATSVDRKSTRLNSSHLVISYAVFCLKKKNTTRIAICEQLARTPTIVKEQLDISGSCHSART